MLYKSTFVVVKVVFSSVLVLPWNAMTVSGTDSERSSLDSKWCVLTIQAALTANREYVVLFKTQGTEEFFSFQAGPTDEIFHIYAATGDKIWDRILNINSGSSNTTALIVSRFVTFNKHQVWEKLKEDALKTITQYGRHVLGTVEKTWLHLQHFPDTYGNSSNACLVNLDKQAVKNSSVCHVVITESWHVWDKNSAGMGLPTDITLVWPQHIRENVQHL